MSVLEIAETPVKFDPPENLGAGTTLQLVPLKFSMRSLPRTPKVPVVPTAQTSVGEMAVTEENEPAPAGTVWTLQDVPLKNSTSGSLEPLLPTAQTALLDAALTPKRSPPLTVGEVTTDQVVPLKFSISGPEDCEPTAQMSVGDTAETALKFDPETVGLVTTLKGPEAGVADATTVTVSTGDVLPT